MFFANTINLGNSPVSGKPYGIFLAIEDADGCSSKAAYPVPDQTTDLYLWGNSNNNVSMGGDNWTDCAKWFKEGRDFHIMPRPGYVAYVYPHPAQRLEWPVVGTVRTVRLGPRPGVVGLD